MFQWKPVVSMGLSPAGKRPNFCTLKKFSAVKKVWLRDWLISAGLKPVLNHTENMYSLRPLRGKKRAFHFIIFNLISRESYLFPYCFVWWIRTGSQSYWKIMSSMTGTPLVKIDQIRLYYIHPTIYCTNFVSMSFFLKPPIKKLIEFINLDSKVWSSPKKKRTVANKCS